MLVSCENNNGVRGCETFVLFSSTVAFAGVITIVEFVGLTAFTKFQ
jgi:hypothetical protein